jgi:ABC-2 type transport system permease protein
LLEKHQDVALKREELTAAIGRFNPVVSAQLLMNRIAQTDVTAHIGFIKRIDALHAELKSFFYKMVFTNTSFRKDQFDQIPDFGK